MLKILFRPHRGSLAAGSVDAQKLFAMLKLIPDSEAARSRSPLALALVIDTSGSMREFADPKQAEQEIAARGLRGRSASSDGADYQGFNLQLPSKLDQAIEAAHRLIDDDRLLPTDKITVAHFDSDAEVLLPLTSLAGKHLAHQAVDKLDNFTGETFMAKGMDCVKQQFCDLPLDTAKRVILLTDGATNDEERCLQLAAQFGEANTPIIAIGIGPDYNEALIRQIAGTSQGRPYPLSNMAELQRILEEEVGSSVREVVTNLQTRVASVKGVKLDSITRVYPSLSDVELAAQPYRLGNVAAGDYTVFVLEFTVSGIERPPSRVRVAQINLSASVPGLGKQAEIPPQDLYLNFTTDDTAIAEVDSEVLSYVQQKNVDRLVQRAVDQAAVNAGEARQTLMVAVGMTQRIGNGAMTQVLQNALDELNKTGGISAVTRKTVVLGGRTRTIKPGDAVPTDQMPSPDEIRKIAGL